MNAPTFLENLLQQGTGIPIPFDAEQSGMALDHLREDILNTDWPQVSHTASRLMAQASAGLDTLAANSLHLPGSEALAERGMMTVILTALLRAENSADNLQALKDALANDDQADADIVTEIITRLDAVAEGSADAFENLPGSTPGQAATPIVPLLAMLVRGLLGIQHAAFNAVYAKPPSIPGATAEQQEQAVKTIIARCESEYLDLLEGMQVACTEANNHELTISQAITIRHYAQRKLPRLARSLAHASLLANRRLQAGSGMAAEEMGNLGARGHQLCREIVAAAVAAQRLAAFHPSAPGDPQLAEVREKAKSLPLVKTLPNGVNRQIHQLSPADDGKFVEVLGRVLSTSSEVDEEDKLIGKIKLEDPSSGAQITAVGFFINPSRIGITEDSFVRWSGIFHSASSLHGGEPAILIDRLPLSELSDEQWRIAFLRLAFDWFPVFRNGHNMSWSLGPHVIQGENLDRAHSGASEMIFLDFGPTPVEENAIPDQP